MGSSNSNSKMDENNKNKKFHRINYEDSPPEEITFHSNHFLEEYPNKDFYDMDLETNEQNHSYFASHSQAYPHYGYPINGESSSTVHDSEFNYLDNRYIDSDNKFLPNSSENYTLEQSQKGYSYHENPVKNRSLCMPPRLISRRILLPEEIVYDHPFSARKKTRQNKNLNIPRNHKVSYHSKNYHQGSVHYDDIYFPDNGKKMQYEELDREYQKFKKRSIYNKFPDEEKDFRNFDPIYEAQKMNPSPISINNYYLDESDEIDIKEENNDVISKRKKSDYLKYDQKKNIEDEYEQSELQFMDNDFLENNRKKKTLENNVQFFKNKNYHQKDFAHSDDRLINCPCMRNNQINQKEPKERNLEKRNESLFNSQKMKFKLNDQKNSVSKNLKEIGNHKIDANLEYFDSIPKMKKNQYYIKDEFETLAEPMIDLQDLRKFKGTQKKYHLIPSINYYEEKSLPKKSEFRDSIEGNQKKFSKNNLQSQKFVLIDQEEKEKILEPKSNVIHDPNDTIISHRKNMLYPKPDFK